jgi:hypothetical protein
MVKCTAGPPCRSTLVRPSWTMRYAEMSSAAGRSLISSGFCASSRRPAERNWSSSRSRSRKPSAGPDPVRSAPSSSERRTPSRRLRSLVHHVVRHTGLDSDHAHRVGDHVVEVPGNPEPLLADRPSALVHALLSQPLGVGKLLVSPRPARPQVLPGQPGNRDREDRADPRGSRRHAGGLQPERDDQSDDAAQIDHHGSPAAHMQTDPEHQGENGVARERGEPIDRIDDQGQVRGQHCTHGKPPVNGERHADRTSQQVCDDRRR